MPHRFLLLKLLNEYDTVVASENGELDPDIKQRLIEDLCHNKVEFVHICEDTSADIAFVNEVKELQGFTTFFLITMHMPDLHMKGSDLLLKIVSHINISSTADVLDLTEEYQVINC